MVGLDPHQKKHTAVAMIQYAVVHFKFANSGQGYGDALE